ncbi:UNVERIFIED_CONTAM: dib [Trichonephila clavipes]
MLSCTQTVSSTLRSDDMRAKDETRTSIGLETSLNFYIPPSEGEYNKSAWHDAQRKKFHQYGSIVREEIAPGYNMIHLFDPRDMEVVSWNEGKFPKREFFVAMRMMREQNPEVYSSAGVAAA